MKRGSMITESPMIMILILAVLLFFIAVFIPGARDALKSSIASIFGLR